MDTYDEPVRQAQGREAVTMSRKRNEANRPETISGKLSLFFRVGISMEQAKKIIAAPASTASSTSTEPNRQGERMMEVTVSGLYRRAVTDV